LERTSVDGNFSHIAREHPEANFDMEFLTGIIPHVQDLADAFRAADRPVVYCAHVLKPGNSEAAFPYWRVGLEPTSWNRTVSRAPGAPRSSTN